MAPRLQPYQKTFYEELDFGRFVCFFLFDNPCM